MSAAISNTELDEARAAYVNAFCRTVFGDKWDEALAAAEAERAEEEVDEK